MKLILGDSLQKLKDLPTSTIDAVVTDPPYGLSFMGKQWDYDVPTIDLWAEVFRVLKPGGHVLSFFGTRTYHAGVIRMEAAGFEIRDMLQWLYGSGFPKSLDVSKAIDKAAGAEREVTGPDPGQAGRKKNTGIVAGQAQYESTEERVAYLTAPATDDAKRWQGWGTALKPANEPIVLARKPLEKGLTVAENVLKWGTGALAIDACRIGVSEGDPNKRRSTGGYNSGESLATVPNAPYNSTRDATLTQGRWPANVLFDEAAAEALDAQSGHLAGRGSENLDLAKSSESMFGNNVRVRPTQENKGGGASRFFYVAKASKRERNAGLEGMPEVACGMMEDDNYAIKTGSGNLRDTKRQNFHPTVKPIKLMEYLCKLIAPPGGIILDPFTGSGTTGCAAVKLGYQFIGIEREQEYIEIAKRRIEHWRTQAPDDDGQLPLPEVPT